jgi:gluconate 2-dehydrogenase gamma chain
VPLDDDQSEELSMRRDPPTRRDFLSLSGSSLGGAWLLGLAPLVAAAQACAEDARRGGRPFTTFTDREGADFDAFAARIVPTDDTPGAREAGVVHFADQALRTFMSELLPIVRAGLARLSDRATAGSDGAPSFADLDQARQDELIALIEREDTEFFFFARMLVMIGLVTNPEHGGNQDGVGWELIGFEDRFAYQPPFGYYDRDEHGPAADGSPR